MTECSQFSFDFASHFSRQVTATFDGGTITSDGGALLLRQADQRMNLLRRLAACFTDHRRPDWSSTKSGRWFPNGSMDWR